MTLATVMAAAERAARAHAEQTREDGETPYVNHVLEVAALVAAHGGTEAEVTAALLHDVLEDSDASADDLRTEFGAEVTALVEALTDDPSWENLSWGEKKRRQAERLGAGAAPLHRIKMADQTSNVRDVTRLSHAWEREEAVDYVAGTELVAAACKGAEPALDALFEEAVREARQTFEQGGSP
jgi:(p)ppGpp synthase/HD superfamily hydrolase